MKDYYYGNYFDGLWVTPISSLPGAYGGLYGGVYGEADYDDKITSGDSLNVLRYSVGLDPVDIPNDNFRWLFEYYTMVRYDIDDDEKITSADALEILRSSVGLSDNKKIGKVVDYLS